MNNLAYHHLLMSCTDKAFHYVQAAQNTDENKNTCMLWKELCHFYEDMSKHNQFALTMEFNACKMKNANIKSYSLVCGTWAHSSASAEGRGT